MQLNTGKIIDISHTHATRTLWNFTVNILTRKYDNHSQYFNDNASPLFCGIATISLNSSPGPYAKSQLHVQKTRRREKLAAYLLASLSNGWQKRQSSAAPGVSAYSSVYSVRFRGMSSRLRLHTSCPPAWSLKVEKPRIRPARACLGDTSGDTGGATRRCFSETDGVCTEHHLQVALPVTVYSAFHSFLQ